MTARIGICVFAGRLLAGEQLLIRKACKPGTVLPIGMQVGDLVLLLDLDGSHLLEKFQSSGFVLAGKGTPCTTYPPGSLLCVKVI